MRSPTHRPHSMPGQFGQSLLVAGLYARLIDALLAAGDVEGAARALEVSRTGEEIPELFQFFPVMLSRGRLRLAQGGGRMLRIGGPAWC